MNKILVVDDERSMREFLEIFLSNEGFAVSTAESLPQAMHLMAEQAADVVVTDLRMKGGSGLELLQQVKARSPDVEVIVITAFATSETALEALKLGAYDYVTKPFQVEEVRVVIHRALERQRLLRDNTRMRAELAGRPDFPGLVGNSPRMQEVYRTVEQIAPTRSNVLITGESGTGKELVARALHQHGQRKDAPFVPVNCASIPESLMESELFGAMKGAYTGAVADRKGLFELAHGGTLFLDEVAEIPLSIQPKLLRVLQDKMVRRLGDSRDREVDVRLLAATNRDIDEEVRQGRFRDDLYFRLNVIRIHLPALRERREDVPALVRHFVQKLMKDEGRPAVIFLDEALAFLGQHDFPGNIRELQNIVERAFALSEGRPIGKELIQKSVQTGPNHCVPEGETLPEKGIALEDVLGGIERNFLQQALIRTGGVKKDAAKLLGISFRSLRYRLLKLGLD